MRPSARQARDHTVILLQRFLEDLRNRFHLRDAAGDLARQRDAGFEIAAEIDVLRAGELAEDVG